MLLSILAKEKHVRDYDVALKKKDGTPIYTSLSCQLLFDDNGQPDGICGILKDITVRKLMEEQLRDSEEKYRNVFAVESDAVFLIDEETEEILDLNEAACVLYQYRQQELKQMKAADLSAEPKLSRRAWEKHQTRVQLHHHRKKDNTIFPVDISLSYLTLKGRSVFLMAIRDVTEQQAAEEELKEHRKNLETLVWEQTQELRMKSEAVEELNVALRVLLRQVQEDKDTLEQRFVANVNKLVLPYLKKINKSRLDKQQSSYLDIMEANLNEIMSPLLHNLQQINLSPREIQVANLVKEGKTTKEIAQIVGVAADAVNSYRNSIRQKLGLNNKKVNLQSYLQSLK